MESFDSLLARLEDLMSEVEGLDEPTRGRILELLDGVDTVHRTALARLAQLLGLEQLAALRQAEPAVDWLFEAYGGGADQRSEAEAALDAIRPYIHSHGGLVEVLEAWAGVVRLKLSGACSGCTASAITLQQGVEDALREHMPGFVAMEVEEEDAAPHPPPGLTLLQTQPKPAAQASASGGTSVATRWKE